MSKNSNCRLTRWRRTADSAGDAELRVRHLFKDAWPAKAQKISESCDVQEVARCRKEERWPIRPLGVLEDRRIHSADQHLPVRRERLESHGVRGLDGDNHVGPIKAFRLVR